MWKDIQAITNYRKITPACDGDSSLPDALNNVYAQFDAQNYVLVRKTMAPHNNQVLHPPHQKGANWVGSGI